MLVQAVGEVSVAAPGAQPAAVKPSTPLPDGATVRTGPSGRAVLLRGRETIVMSPSSAITLPAGATRDFTKVRQQSGTLLFKIGKKPEAHFEVDTPYLAAVVKGTTFTVKVASAGASVHVLEGAVEVATADRKSSFLTRAGQISSVFAKAAGDIFTTGAASLSGPSGGGELWGTDVTGSDVGSDFFSGSATTQTRVFHDTGLKARSPAAKKDDALTERAPARMMKAAKSVDETMATAKSRSETHRPKDVPAKPATTEKSRPETVHSADATKRPGEKSGHKTDARTRASAPAPKVANVWTITQAQGEIKVDGYPFTNFGDGRVRTLPPGTKIETGAASRFGVAHGMRNYVIEANSVAFLGDIESQAEPKVVSGAALQYSENSGRYEAVRNLSPEEIETLRAEGLLDGGPSNGGGAGAVLAGGTSGGAQTASSDPVALPKLHTGAPRMGTKTEEVRTKVISGLTLGLYGLTALLVLAFGAQWAWRRYRSKAKGPQTESVAQARLRSIKDA